MKNEELKKVINQIRHYGLIESFKNDEELKSWLSSLNKKQIDNFISLSINTDEIDFPLFILTDLNMLNCTDYEKRIKALSTLKNGDGCWHLFDRLLEPKFLQSDNYYQDIEMLSNADTARYALWIIGEENFINSPYHTEDLKLIIETHDIKKENPKDFIVSDALATVANDVNSIKSPYHQADMNLIATSGSDCLQASNTYPKNSLNSLATNKVSLNDKYHLENMRILATNPVAKDFLYIIMTDPNIIKSKNYRKEVEALVNAKSTNTARAIYYYIVNPDRKFKQDMNFPNDCKIDYIEDAYIVSKNSVVGSKTPNYLQNLATINQISDRFVMHYVSLLMNPSLINSEFMDYDLKLLKSITDVSVFMDLYRFITDETSLKNPFHESDIELLSKTSDAKIRELLLQKATDEYSLKSQNRGFDLEYIYSLDVDSIDKEIFKQMYYFLFSQDGIDAKDHQETLNNLYQGIYFEASNQVSNYLNTLEQNLNHVNEEDSLIETTPIIGKKKTKTLTLFKKSGKK